MDSTDPSATSRALTPPSLSRIGYFQVLPKSSFFFAKNVAAGDHHCLWGCGRDEGSEEGRKTTGWAWSNADEGGLVGVYMTKGYVKDLPTTRIIKRSQG